MRSLSQLSSQTLVAEGSLVFPFFSPDNAWVGFYDRSEQPFVLKRVPVGGGAPETICELPGGMYGASWGSDGNIIFAAASPGGGGLWRVPALGGEPVRLTTFPDQPLVRHHWPETLPGNDAVLFTITADPIEESQIAVLSIDTGEQETLIHDGSNPKYSSTGHMVYSRSGTLWAVPFDLERLETTGASFPVQEGVLAKSNRGGADFELSEDGSLVYVPAASEGSGARSRTLVWVNRQGLEEPLDAPPAPYEVPRVSPDGGHVAVEVNAPNGRYVRVYDREGNSPTRLTTGPGIYRSPLWSLDGQRVMFSSEVGGSRSWASRAFDGTGPIETLARPPGVGGASWLEDGRTLIVGLDSGVEDSGIGLLSIGSEGQLLS